MSNQPTISEKFDKERKFQAPRNVVTQMMFSFWTGLPAISLFCYGIKGCGQQVLKAFAIV